MQIPTFLSDFTEKLLDEPMPIEKPVDLSVDAVTPISRTPISQVNRLAWNDMTAVDLQEQYFILESRYYTILGMGKPDIAKQMLKGLEDLRKLMNKRAKEVLEDSRKKYNEDTNGGNSK
jgi:hypothetical protein